MTALAALLSSSIVQTVALGAAVLGVVGGVLGVFAVLRKQSLVGDTLSHAALPGVCLGFMVAGARDLSSILAGAFLSGALAALTVMLIARATKLKTDAALGIVLSVYFAVGIVLLTHLQSTGAAGQAGLSTFLFGQAAAILRSDLWILGGVTAAVLALVALLWKEFKLVSFDPDYARAMGFPVLALETLLTLMIALAVVVGLQMVGVVLMVAMLIAPAAAARQWTKSLEGMVLLAAFFGAVSGVVGALISAGARGLATGPVVVLVASAIVFVSILVAPGRGLAWRALAAARQRRSLEGRRVLATMSALSDAHGDPAYRAEQGMLDAFHGTPTADALARLEARGLVERVDHPPETSPHFALTAAGRAQARVDGGEAPESAEARP